jgi:hypothetical protein
MTCLLVDLFVGDVGQRIKRQARQLVQAVSSNDRGQEDSEPMGSDGESKKPADHCPLPGSRAGKLRGAVRTVRICAIKVYPPTLSCCWAGFSREVICALRRIGLHDTDFAKATCGTIRLKLFKIGAIVRISVRRIKIAMASACPVAQD